MKTFKRALSVLLVTVMLLTAAPLSGFVGLEWPDIDLPSFAFPEINLPDFDFNFSADAAEVVNSGSCGTNVTYSLDSDGVLTISGTGEMTNYSSTSSAPWNSNRSAIKTVLIENGVTSIMHAAFEDCTSLTSVTIPDSVTSIGEHAFSWCTKLTSVTIPDSVTSIGDGAFFDCTKLTSVTIGDSVTSIGEYAFSGCTSLTSVTIGDSVTSIGNYAFYYCDSLTSVTIPDSVTSIGDYAFYYCTSLTSVTIGDSVTSIGEYAFNRCESLTSVTIPDSVTSIGDWAFAYCTKLTSVTIPDSVTSIGDGAFEDCTSLTSVTIPDSVTSIGIAAFCHCKSLTSVIIGNSVTSIGVAAFCNCTSLTDITVDADNTAYCSAEGVLFNKSKTELIQYPVGNTRTSYTIPDSVKSIENDAFRYCTSLTSVTIGDSVTSVGDSAFFDCTSLTSVTIPDSVTSIGDRAFYYCRLLTSVTIPDSVTSIGDYVFYNCDSLTSVTIGDSVTSIGESAFSYCTSLTSVTIGDNVTSFGEYAFNRCESLTSVTIPDSVTSIGDWAFAYCTKLTSVIIPDSVTSIGYLAFCNCTSLTSVIIGDSVTSIGDRAFYSCRLLTSITIPDSVTSIGYGAFFYCTSLIGISVDADNTAYCSEDGVLFNKSNTELIQYPVGNARTSYTIPDSVTSIGYSAFEYCTSLTSVIIPDSVTRIWEGAFYGCTSLTDVYYSGSEVQWAKISIGSNNTPLTNAMMHFVCQFYRKSGKEYNYKFSYCDDLFAASSSEYDNDLCIASAALAFHAGTPDDKNTTAPLNAIETFKQMGFDTWKAYGYADAYGKEIVPTFDSIACIIGSKQNVNLNGKKKTIVAVAVRGLGYRAEWGGNFNIGMEEEHAGFNEAKKQVLTYLNFYLSENALTDDNVIYWVTGYSRAGATANLVAAHLTRGGSGYANIVATKPGKNTVFGYMFATPNNTTDISATSTVYDNIINIINPIDIVPTMAPETWGFKKYGVCYFLPAQEYTPRYKAPDGLYKKMQESFYSISGYTYKEDFVFYELGIDIDWNLLFDADIGIEFRATNTMGQMSYINNLVKVIAEDVLRSREYCVDNYQSVLQKTIASCLGGWKCDNVSSDSLIQMLSDALKVNFLEIIANPSTATVSTILKTVLAETTVYTAAEIDTIADDLAQIIIRLLLHPNYLYTTIMHAMKTSSTGMNMLMTTHEFENYMCWLALIGKDGVTKDDVLTKAKNYKELLVNCPVNVNVYDSDGTLVASIVDNKSVDVGEYSLCYYVDEDGQKRVAIPYGEEYRVEIIATDTGSVNCSIQEIGADGITVDAVVNFDAVAVEKDDVLICEIAENTEDNGNPGTMTDQSGEEVASDVLSNDEIKEYTVTVASDHEGGIIFGGGTYISGEFAQVSAFDTEEYAFIGWYDGENLVSTEYTYRFAVTEDKNLTARWDNYCKVKGHTEEIIPAVAATCTQTGLTEGKKCSVCDEVLVAQTETEKLAHEIVIVGEKEATDTQNGYTGDVVCDVCGEVLVLGDIIFVHSLQNVALGKDVVFSSHDNVQHNNAYLTDGEKADKIWDGGTENAYFIVDLDGLYKISSLAVFIKNRNINTSDFVVEYSPDNEHYEKAEFKRTDSDYYLQFGLDQAVDARYVKVTIHCDDALQNLLLSEVEVYGEKSANSRTYPSKNTLTYNFNITDFSYGIMHNPDLSDWLYDSDNFALYLYSGDECVYTGEKRGDIKLNYYITGVKISAQVYDPLFKGDSIVSFELTGKTDTKDYGILFSAEKYRFEGSFDETYYYVKHIPLTDYNLAGSTCEDHVNESEFISPTCTIPGQNKNTCLICGAVTFEQTDVPALGHTEEIIPAVAATCTQTGLTEGKKCSVCGEVLVAQAVIDKTSHKPTMVGEKAATATQDGYTGDTVCATCGMMIEEGKVIPATGDSSGSGRCDHLCHKDGILGFFWKILRLFFKLFQINPVCECGAAHY